MRKRLRKTVAFVLVASMVTGILLYGKEETTGNKVIYYTVEPEVHITQLSVKKHSKEEIAAMYKKLNIGNLEDKKNTYKTKPSVKKPYATGTLSDTSINNGLTMINFYRYVAGVDDHIKVDSEKQKYAEAASLIQAIIGDLEHHPEPKPSGMTNEMYQLCYDGSNRSLLSLGHITTAESITGLIYDNDNPDVAHRTVLLDPKLDTVGIGMVDDFCAVCPENKEWEKRLHDADTAVAWPAYNTPVELCEYYVHGCYPYWSVSFAKENLSEENLKVTVTRKRDGKVWKFTEADDRCTVDDKRGTISFQLGFYTYKVGDVYNVKIKGKTIDLDYDVNFFSVKSPNRGGTAPAPVVLTRDKTIKYSTLQKKSVSFQIIATAKTPIEYIESIAPRYYNAKTKVYKNGEDYITVSKTGKVTLKKGAPKGTYKIALWSTTGTKYYYKSGRKYLTIKVK